MIEDVNGQSVKVAYLSPQGRVLDQAGVEEIASRDRLVLLCGRYQGIDQRVIDQEVDEEWSVGDFCSIDYEIFRRFWFSVNSN